MAENGRGYLQITTEWSNDDTFNQRPRLKRILNPFRVLVDPSAQELDQRDAEYAFLETDYDQDTWKEEFGSKDKPLPTNAGTDWSGTETSTARAGSRLTRRSASWTGTARSTRR